MAGVSTYNDSGIPRAVIVECLLDYFSVLWPPRKNYNMYITIDWRRWSSSGSAGHIVHLRGTKWIRGWYDIVVFGYFNHFKGRVILFFSSIYFFMCSICIMQVSTLDYHNYLSKYYKKFDASIAYLGAWFISYPPLLHQSIYFKVFHTLNVR